MSLTLAQILEVTGGRWVNRDSAHLDPEKLRVDGPSPLDAAKRSHVAFFFSKEFQSELPKADPAVLVTAPPFVEPLGKSGLPLWKTAAVVACDDPYLALALLSEKFGPSLTSNAHVPGQRGDGQVHPTAVLDPSAKIGSSVQISAHVVVEAGARIGDGVVLYPGVTIGRESAVGDDSVLFPRVTVYERCVIGKRARIHAGAVIGSDGFGFAPRFKDKMPVGHQKIYHLGRVVIGDDVEIGANTCIDRGTFGDTTLKNQVKLDNQVHIGHNAQLDEGAVVCGGTALAGSASLGKFAYIGGLTGITNKVHVGDGAKVGAVSLVSKDVPPGKAVVGNPAREYAEHFRAHAALNKLAGSRRKKEK